jgi:hypothetical protein
MALGFLFGAGRVDSSRDAEPVGAPLDGRSDETILTRGKGRE